MSAVKSPELHEPPESPDSTGARLQLLWQVIAATLAGTLSSASYLPQQWAAPAPLGLAILFALVWRSTNVKRAAGAGAAYGFAFFVSGLWWVFAALSGHVGLPVAGAAIFTMVFCAVLALFPALATGAAVALSAPGGFARLLCLAACWVLVEWLRSWLFTGFPWMLLGYSQIPNGLAASWAPIAGVLGVSFAVAAGIACVFALFSLRRRRLVAGGSLLFIVAAAPLINTSWQWTTPAGALSVSLLQGNVRQSLKWEAAVVEQSLSDYLRMASAAEGRIIIMPETALPMRMADLPLGYVDELQRIAGKQAGALIVGVFEEDENGIYNAAALIEEKRRTSYRKVHLTPYGEYLPLRAVLAPALGAMGIPYAGLSPGQDSAPLSLPDGIAAAISICYESIFGAEWRRQTSRAQFLINITNDAWFDSTIMPEQHFQMAQARAMESGRWLVRAANTGITAVINRQGQTVARLPKKVRGALTEEIMLYRGKTPYQRFGDAPLLLLCALILAGGFMLRAARRYREKSAAAAIDAAAEAAEVAEAAEAGAAE